MNTMMTLQSGGAGDGAHTRMTQAWQWLCDQRSTAPDAADIRDIHHQQASQDAWLRELTDRVLRGEYRLSPVQLSGQGESRRAVWGAQDALVLKWVALGIQSLLPLHPACEHVKGHGGGKPSIRTLHHLLTETEKKTAADTTPADSADARGYRWVCRTDIRGYYRNINKATLLNQVRQSVHDPVLTDLVNQYIHYTVEDGGTFHTPQKGISRGCPLSPLMGAVHLYEMDAYFAQQKDIHYARYMDDIIILAKSRWSLRRHTKRLKQWFSEEGFEAHPDKTQIGRTEKGFDWMGAWLTHEGVTDIAPRAKANHREKVRRLYERLARVPLWRRKRARQQVNARVSTYRKRWNIWAGALLCITGAACADSPLIVIASGNVAGDTGARYPFSVGPTTVYNVQSTGDYGGLCLSLKVSDACKLGGQGRARRTAAGWGIELRRHNGDWSGLVMVPRGLATRTGAGPDEAASLNLADGTVTYGDGTVGVACTPIEGDTDKRGTWYRWQKTSTCPYSTTVRGTQHPGSLSASGSLVAYALGPLAPSVLIADPLYIGHHTGQDIFQNIPKPNQIIISGLNCNVQVVNVSGAHSSGSGTPSVSIDYGEIAGGAAGKTVASAALAVTTSCGGANSSDPAAHVTAFTEFAAGPGTGQDTAGFLRGAGVRGHYLTLNQNAGDCNTSGAVTHGTSGLAYAPGAPGTVSSETVVASLCSDGTTPTLGPHSIQAVATLVTK